jgi:hypothetical protein
VPWLEKLIALDTPENLAAEELTEEEKEWAMQQRRIAIEARWEDGDMDCTDEFEEFEECFPGRARAGDEEAADDMFGMTDNEEFFDDSDMEEQDGSWDEDSDENSVLQELEGSEEGEPDEEHGGIVLKGAIGDAAVED